MDRSTARRISLTILACGSAAAVVIYFVAPPPEPNPLGYDPLTNKRYVLEMERFGGKANLMTAEFMQWFDHLWHGQTLAYTVAVLTALIAWGFWYVATFPPAEPEERPDAR